MKNKFCVELEITRFGRGETWTIDEVDETDDYKDFLYILDLVEKDSDCGYWVIFESEETLETALMIGISKIRSSIQDS